MLPTNHITRAQERIATIEGLATGYRQPRHLQQIVTPARTGGRIGRNHWRGISMSTALALMAGVAIALAVLTSLTIQP